MAGRDFVTSVSYLFVSGRFNTRAAWEVNNLWTASPRWELFVRPRLHFPAPAPRCRTRWTCLWMTLSRWTGKEAAAAAEDHRGPVRVQVGPGDRRGQRGVDRTTSTGRETTGPHRTPGYEREAAEAELKLKVPLCCSSFLYQSWCFYNGRRYPFCR